VRLPDEALTDAIVRELRDLHRLTPQKEAIAELIERAAASEFASDDLRAAVESGRLSRENIMQKLERVNPPEDDWRLGETLGRQYLHRLGEYHFPAPATQDARNQDGSLPGTDYIGFRRIEGESPRFAFGEVKTSKSKARPPQLMYGSTGMVAQLIDLLPDGKGAWDQILYLGTHAAGTTWQLEFAEAFCAIDADDLDFDLLGILIRPLAADSDERLDLESRCSALAREISGMRRGALLLAFYLSEKSFDNIRERWSQLP
jgi:hypothetical protein